MGGGRQEAIYLHRKCAPLNYCCVAGTWGVAGANDAVVVVVAGADCVGAAAAEAAAGMVPPSLEVAAEAEEKAHHPDGVLQLRTYLS